MRLIKNGKRKIHDVVKTLAESGQIELPGLESLEHTQSCAVFVCFMDYTYRFGWSQKSSQ